MADGLRAIRHPPSAMETYMRIGINTGLARGTSLNDLLAQFERAEQAGFASAWLSNIFGPDALTVLALAGQRTQRIELGTAVVPTYPRHRRHRFQRRHLRCA